MGKPMNLQNWMLNAMLRSGKSVTVFLVNGYQMKGIVTGFDNFVVILAAEGKQHMIYKHAISTVIPSDVVLLKQQEESCDD